PGNRRCAFMGLRTRDSLAGPSPIALRKEITFSFCFRDPSYIEKYYFSGHFGPMNANLRPAQAAKLSEKLAEATPTEIVQEALRTIVRERLAVASSFGIESATLLKIVADVDSAIPVLFLDTGWLFPETIAYRDTPIKQRGPKNQRQ